MEAVRATGEYPERMGEPACQVSSCIVIDCNTINTLLVVDNLTKHVPGRCAYNCCCLASIMKLYVPFIFIMFVTQYAVLFENWDM